MAVSNGRDNDRAQDSGHRAVGPVLGSDLQVVGPVRDDGHQADVWRNDPRDVDAAAGPPSQASVAAEPQACKGHADVRALAGAGAAVVSAVAAVGVAAVSVAAVVEAVAAEAVADADPTLRSSTILFVSVISRMDLATIASATTAVTRPMSA